MQVTVHYLAQLRRAAGASSERVDIGAGSTIADLVRVLGERHGESFRALVHPSLLYFIGDEPAAPTNVLRDGAEVTILTPMAGGSLAWR